MTEIPPMDLLSLERGSLPRHQRHIESSLQGFRRSTWLSARCGVGAGEREDRLHQPASAVALAVWAGGDLRHERRWARTTEPDAQRGARLRSSCLVTRRTEIAFASDREATSTSMSRTPTAAGGGPTRKRGDDLFRAWSPGLH
jgi:hypothetical protein